MNNKEEIRLMLSLGNNYLSFRLNSSKKNENIGLLNMVDSILIDANKIKDKTIKNKNGKNIMILRKQGAKFTFSINQNQPDVLQKVVLLIFLEKKDSLTTSNYSNT